MTEIVAQVKFITTDSYGLWDEGDMADDLGWESDHPDAPPIRLLRLHRDEQVICLTDPYTRGLIEAVHPYSEHATGKGD